MHSTENWNHDLIVQRIARTLHDWDENNDWPWIDDDHINFMEAAHRLLNVAFGIRSGKEPHNGQA